MRQKLRNCSCCPEKSFAYIFALALFSASASASASACFPPMVLVVRSASGLNVQFPIPEERDKKDSLADVKCRRITRPRYLKYLSLCKMGKKNYTLELSTSDSPAFYDGREAGTENCEAAADRYLDL